MIRQPIALIIAGLIALPSYAVPAFAEDPPPFPEFSARRVGVPKAGGGPRINVSIEPKADIVAAQPTPDEDADGAPRPYDWFWSDVSPQLAQASAGRLEATMTALQDGERDKRVTAPRLGDMRKITDAYGKDILLATIGTRVSPALVAAIIHVESGGRADALSSAGASGLMQLIPATAERFGVEDADDPADNIKGGVAYLDWLMGEFDHDPVMILAGYNAGENAVKSHKGVPPYAETRAYVPKVLAAWRVASGLCQTPPQLITDGCAFVQIPR
ncbi:MAG: lytic transglycosylase domain-containing protein [Alphaproteobacteria bacterium]|nr:lytic transglycosylase domain-containing protein [Alphaproteobacteria bacterium]NNF24731.1 lytic transglycosylase domain-containing protein [Paracoccaceae bacterium]